MSKLNGVVGRVRFDEAKIGIASVFDEILLKKNLYFIWGLKMNTPSRML